MLDILHMFRDSRRCITDLDEHDTSCLVMQRGVECSGQVIE